MGALRKPQEAEAGASATALRPGRTLLGALLAAAFCLPLLGCAERELKAEELPRLDFADEKVPFAPPRPPKPKLDLIKAKDGRFWRRLVNDGLHDKSNPDVGKLREPAKVLAKLPGKREEIGNNVDWVAALRSGAITPEERLVQGAGAASEEREDSDIIMPRTAAMPMVRFPHKAHNEWLDCSNCHDDLFVKKAGGNVFNMADILAGEYCGRCHGAVAFPPTDCVRCHSVEREAGVAN